MTGLTQLTASDLARRIRQRELSAEAQAGHDLVQGACNGRCMACLSL